MFPTCCELVARLGGAELEVSSPTRIKSARVAPIGSTCSTVALGFGVVVVVVVVVDVDAARLGKMVIGLATRDCIADEACGV